MSKTHLPCFHHQFINKLVDRFPPTLLSISTKETQTLQCLDPLHCPAVAMAKRRDPLLLVDQHAIDVPNLGPVLCIPAADELTWFCHGFWGFRLKVYIFSPGKNPWKNKVGIGRLLFLRPQNLVEPGLAKTRLSFFCRLSGLAVAGLHITLGLMEV